MAATVVNISGTEDTHEGWKTYYLRVHADGEVFYKIGLCKGAVYKRYGKEPKKTHLEILKIWHHPTESAAYQHEEKLFKDFPGDRPYIGQCGPFRFGGNTETYSHNVMEGEPSPHRFVVRMHSLDDLCLHTYGYSGRNPKRVYERLDGQVRYMDYAFGPKGLYVQVPKLSHPETVTLATRDYIQEHLDGGAATKSTKEWAEDAYFSNIKVKTWEDYSKMRFEGSRFYVGPYEIWV
jgi:hypothetical protein